MIFWMMLYGTVLGYAQSPVIRNVSAAEFKKVMDSLKDEVVLDVRTAEEIQKGKIPGAIAVDFYGKDFKPAIESLDRSKTYLVYCSAGRRSAKAAELMKNLGFKQVYNLEAGYDGWAKQRMPVEKSNQ